MFSDVLSIFINLYAKVLGFSVFQWNLLFEVYGFGKFAPDPHLKHVFGFQPLRSLRLLLEFHGLKGDFL